MSSHRHTRFYGLYDNLWSWQQHKADVFSYGAKDYLNLEEALFERGKEREDGRIQIRDARN